MIDIRQLRYFVALAETRHFRRAAQRLHISQPPLSCQIAALEKALGARLLERHAHGATLTYAGEIFLAEARDVLSAFDRACRNAQLAERGELGNLAIGFMMHTAYTSVPELTRRFITHYPQVQLKLRETIPGLLADKVLNGQFDAGILFNPGPVDGLEGLSLYRERLCLALYTAHPLAQRSQLNARDLQGEALIATPHEVARMLRDAIEVYCRSGGVAPHFRLETQLQQTIISSVAEELGIALVPQ
ncbi:LysR family transcriptional regulator [Candidatus Symbiopectobacterium sp. 'North America']|uniref:LysR family transcriptional regulator n=1 Tax=Candidatus Symbiopectobacterium sp. 'North America' TaxID=2794574 RepID=UPI0018C9F238|nr:LysR substrate-binding domain-containing protein [Candidatus Symbiopectobacterium sp. 'North America']